VPCRAIVGILTDVETPLSITEEPESPNGGFAIVLGPRQLAAVFVVAIFAAGILCSLSYIVGRAAPRPSVPAHVSPPPATAPASAPLTLRPVPCPATPAPAAAAAAPAPSEWKNADPVDGALYIQVMSGVPGIADAIARGLHARGIQAIVVPGVGPSVQRVLVGPIPDGSVSTFRARLDALGFTYFVRRYSKNSSAEPPKLAQ